jgi:hypothetical protein
MLDQNGHLTDEALIKLIDGEESKAVADAARAHSAECLACRSRRSQLEKALSEFADLYATTNPPTLESGSDRRAELRDRLSGASLSPTTSRFEHFTQHRSYLFVAAAIVAIAIAASLRISTLTQNQSTSTQATLGLLPDKSLTPGATQPVNLVDVCSQQDDDLDPAVSDPIKKAVFQEYGMSTAKTDGYQVDYLINPQLGGTADVRNLWPEPYGPTVWNAHAKDALEDRLRSMVCDNQIDLASAQQEIAQDWIAAYKKYVHAGNPT